MIGGGTGGLISSLIAAGAGARVALIERERTGGDCLWTGCVPSKALLAAAGTAHQMRRADRFGIASVEPDVGFSSVMDSVRAAQSTIEPHDSPERLRREGVDVIEGNARFTGPGRLLVDDTELKFRSAIIATGSAPVIPPVPGLRESRPMTTDSIWDLEHLPDRLAVIGGGPIGCELGQAFSRLGSEVTIIEADDRLLPREEPESSRLVTGAFESEGIDAVTGTTVTGVESSPDGIRMRSSGEDGDSHDWEGTHLLVAVGRSPRTSELGLDSVSVAVNAGGSIEVDNRMKTSASGIYAVGDVTGVMPFTHVAAQQARAAAPNAVFGLRTKVDYSSVPWATFTDPEVARVGLSEGEARSRWGDKVRIVQFDYENLDRAIVDGRPSGFAKLIGDRKGRLVGATIAAQGAGDAIAEMAAWINQGAGISDISRQVHAYPTMAEGASRAANEYVSAQFLTPRNRALIKPVLALKRRLHDLTRRS
ncbi:MAG: FAD-dependent oxidoreductase [Solirubrobacterales bacterium]|nr:FAD-dependent oxidoreductase [Solirubrobacterales bacterium]